MNEASPTGHMLLWLQFVCPPQVEPNIIDHNYCIIIMSQEFIIILNFYYEWASYSTSTDLQWQ